jgi:type I restriction enzyme, S subunit
MSDLNDLPEGWIKTKFSEITNKIVDGSHNPPPKADLGLPMLSARNIEGGLIRFEEDYRLISEQDFEREDRRTKIKSGDILLTIVGAIGRCAVVPKNIQPFTLQRSVAVLSPVEVDSQFLSYQLQSPNLQKDLLGRAKGTAQKGVYLKSLNELTIDIPPLNEQRRIVSTIEQMTDRSHKARAALEDVPKLIAQFRQSALAAAFRGDLTADWREKNPDVEPASEFLQRIGIEPQSPLDFLEIHSLPQKWKWASVGSISKISGGLTKNSKREEFPLEYPYLRVANVYANKLDLQEIKTIRINQQELARVLLEKGDILVVEGNGSIDQVGRVAMWDGSISPCLHQNHLIKIRFNLPEMAEFALLWLLSEQGRRYIMSVASSSSGLHTLSLSKVSALPIPVAPENEQKEIVKRITALFDALTVIETRFTSSEEELNQLDRSILAKAFRGELVPQDPNDEPAAVLLKRIRAEREQTSTPKQHGKTTRKNSSKQLSIEGIE